ncbi:proteasome ATPase [Kocuria massiliensis]|uniref:proteasome ATPase n=1 Tax=Kocuria massiliensis TaxID=1926282 RepID=UPI000A1CD730|nr:proteasome ATPase [Kocuria massiliensis]
MAESESTINPRDHEMTLRQLNVLRDQRLNLNKQLKESTLRNDKLVRALEGARSDIQRLKQAIAQDLEAPMNQAQVVRVNHRNIWSSSMNDDVAPLVSTQASLDVVMGGRRIRIPVSPVLSLDEVKVGMTVLLTETVGACACVGYRETGEIASVREILGSDRLVLGTGSNNQVVALRSGQLVESEVKIGDAVSFDSASGIALSLVPKSDAEDLVLEDTPNVSYEDIGGLTPQIEQIRDAVELPFLYPELYREHDLKPPKGILLYGPPGNGKTLIAKAVAKSLADRMTGDAQDGTLRGYFLNIKGPELLDKFVGETERQIRAIFARARDKATAGNPVVIFFDEMESLFRTRGAGKSSDVETTIVPQLLAEIDGVESLDNVIVIGATNREDMIDPAVLRPGRLDVKVRIDRPDYQGTGEIFGLYVHSELPLRADDVSKYGGDRNALAASMIETVVADIFTRDEEHRYLDAVLVDGRRIPAYWSDFLSGALIHNIVDRAKKLAIKSFLDDEVKGLSVEHLVESARTEFLQQRDSASRGDVEDWLGRIGHSVPLSGIEFPSGSLEASHSERGIS